VTLADRLVLIHEAIEYSFSQGLTEFTQSYSPLVIGSGPRGIPRGDREHPMKTVDGRDMKEEKCSI